jgi:hypothetical protein
MLNKIKLICAVTLILSMVGLAAISITEGNWRTFALGVLYSIANVIIFII